MRYKELKPASVTERGQRTWEWKFPDGRQITVFKRNRGETFGGHFHTGKDPSKNPEKLLLVYGVVSGLWMSMADEIGTILLDASQNPVEMTFPPFAAHELVAERDCLLIEYRTTHFDPQNPDTYPNTELFRKFSELLPKL